MHNNFSLALSTNFLCDLQAQKNKNCFVQKLQQKKQQLSGTQFDKIVTRYESWEVLSPPYVRLLFLGNFVHVCNFFSCHSLAQVSDTFKRGVTERGVFAFACQYIVSPCGRTGNRTVTQMRHPLLVEGRPNCARQSLASTLSAPRVAATSYCDPRRHANVVTPCLFTPCLNVP